MIVQGGSIRQRLCGAWGHVWRDGNRDLGQRIDRRYCRRCKASEPRNMGEWS